MRLVLRDPIEGIEHAHRSLVGNLELLELRADLALEPAYPHGKRVADCKARIARRERVVTSRLCPSRRASTDPSGAAMVLTTPPRDCLFPTKSGLEEWHLVGALLETEAVLGLAHDVGGKPMRVVGVGKIAPHERAAAFLALERGVDDELAGIEHVDGVDGVEPLVIDLSCRS